MVRKVALFGSLALLFVLRAANAAAILWSELTVDLDTLGFNTTGNLEVTFTDGTPTGTLVSRDVISSEDIVHVSESPFTGSQFLCPECNYVGYGTGGPNAWDPVTYTWGLSSIGSGSLVVEVDFSWVFAALAGALPDGIAGGPDNYAFSYSVNDAGCVKSGNSFPPMHFDYTLSCPETFFAEGEIETFSLTLYTNANGAWIEKPSPSYAVPEPPTVAVLFAGLAAIGLLRMKS